MKRQPRSSPRSGKPHRTVSIIGTGSYVPEKILTNDDLSRMVDTSDEWITTRTGIKERRVAAKDEYTSDMATKAALKAIEQAEISPRGNRSDSRRDRHARHDLPGDGLFCAEQKSAQKMPPASMFPPPAPDFFSRLRSRSNSSLRTPTTRCSSSARRN